MTEYRTDEEQVEALQRWWRDHGMQTIVAVVLVAVAIFGWRAWQDSRASDAADASLLYQELLETAQRDDEAGVATRKFVIQQLRESHGEKAYGGLAAMFSAKEHVAGKDFAAAEADLRWALESGMGDTLKDVARLRLARVLWANEQPDDALAILQDMGEDSLAVDTNELRGDILFGQGDRAAARDAYAKAVAASPAPQGLLEMKLDDASTDTDDGTAIAADEEQAENDS